MGTLPSFSSSRFREVASALSTRRSLALSRFFSEAARLVRMIARYSAWNLAAADGATCGVVSKAVHPSQRTKVLNLERPSLFPSVARTSRACSLPTSSVRGAIPGQRALFAKFRRTALGRDKHRVVLLCAGKKRLDAL